jgi:glucose/arabinose dehydrogenase
MRRILLISLVALTFVGACTSDKADAPGVVSSGAGASTAPSVSTTSAASAAPSAGATTDATALKVGSTIATGLKSPWGLAFLPDGTALVSLRDPGQIVSIKSGVVATVGTVPGVASGGEAGLLGIAVAPTFSVDRWVYAYLTTSADNRIVRMKLGAGDVGLGEPEVLVKGIEEGAIHDGGRLVFGPDGMLYAGVGDANNRPNAQNLASMNGKILRMTPEGKVPADNPEPKSLVYSSGHRNVQGLAFDSSGRLWASEFGQDTWDELNVIKAGGNYGWPDAEGKNGGSKFIDPLVQWNPDDASPSGIAIVGNAVVLAALKGTKLWVVPISGATTGTPVPLLAGQYGRFRTVAVAPDGSVWAITSNTDGRGDVKAGDDRILRLTA